MTEESRNPYRPSESVTHELVVRSKLDAVPAFLLKQTPIGHPRNFSTRGWKPRFYDIPDKLVVNISVSMDEDISERNDFLIVRNALDQHRIQLRHLTEGFAYDFELTLDAPLQ